MCIKVLKKPKIPKESMGRCPVTSCWNRPVPGLDIQEKQ